MSREWHKAAARRYQHELEAMDELEFALLGIGHIKFAYVVLVVVQVIMGGITLRMGINEAPGMLIAMQFFVYMALPCMLYSHYTLARTVKAEQAKIWSMNMSITKEQVAKMKAILDRAILEKPGRFDIVSVEKEFLGGMMVTHVHDELKFENNHCEMGRIKVLFAASEDRKRKIITAIDIRGVPVNIFYTNTGTLQDNTSVLFDQMLELTTKLFGFTE